MVFPSGFSVHSLRGQDSALRVAVMVFNILSAVGFFFLAAILLTALLSSRVKRVSAWYGYILAWMAFCIPPSLVLGHQTHLDSPPSFQSCVVDSALMYASRPFAGFATLSLLLQMYLNVSTRLRHGEVRLNWIFFLIALPPGMFLFMFLWTLAVGIANPSQVELEPTGFYCHLNNPVPAIVGAALVVLATSSALLVEGLTMLLLSRNWRAFRILQRRDEHAVSLSLIIRVSVFGILPIIGLGLSFTTYVPNLPKAFFLAYNILLASFPAAAALIFGSQMDIIGVWMFWRRDEIGEKPDPGRSTTNSSAA
ncbi:hypothetical protein C8F04DRAFT_1123816 [Mycena alexandri]|uniref:G protein-coupled receptor n=1 Tax=Mycena alexandri TaxID=1745969 RepID=A0AAD6SFG8_9AGAR|nr:hypothetical protein C8F04DRAFT_1131323 [Mycena alexandri]KAJ7026971.1 hypothetical protein C8F04DRAFT_1123816 [Mycena alexandri]